MTHLCYFWPLVTREAIEQPGGECGQREGPGEVIDRPINYTAVPDPRNFFYTSLTQKMQTQPGEECGFPELYVLRGDGSPTHKLPKPEPKKVGPVDAL